MQDVSNGKLRSRKWPEPRGKPKTKAEKARQDKFRNANVAAKYAPPQVVSAVTQAVRGTPLMPRDLLVSMFYGRLAMFVLPDGRKLWPMAAKQEVSDALDVLSQSPGTILVRGETLWEPITLAELIGAQARASLLLNGQQNDITGNADEAALSYKWSDTPSDLFTLSGDGKTLTCQRTGVYLLTAVQGLSGNAAADYWRFGFNIDGAPVWRTGLNGTSEGYQLPNAAANLYIQEGDELQVIVQVGGATKTWDALDTDSRANLDITLMF